MFLHLVTDEKFTDSAITQFNRNDPGNHVFILLCTNTMNGFRYIHQTKAVRKILAGSEEYNECLSSLSSYEAVFLHGLFSPHVIEMVNKASCDAVLVWLFWGGELWSFKDIRTRMMLPSTRRVYQWNTFKSWLDPNIRKYASLLKQMKFRLILANFVTKHRLRGEPQSSQASLLKNVICRVNYVIPVVRDDFDVLKKHFDLKADVLDWNYSSGITLDSREGKIASGNNILVGNSAHYTNNHLEIFRYIRKIKNWDGQVIVPLSYGDMEYRKYVFQAGKKYFNSRFVPLDTFLPVEQYFTLLESCSYAFFNTLRQQAMGNIIILLHQGTKVFLREENPVYQFLKRRGIALFSIQQNLSGNTNMLFERMTKESVTQNRSILKSLYGEETLNAKTQNLLNILRHTRRG